MKGCS